MARSSAPRGCSSLSAVPFPLPFSTLAFGFGSNLRAAAKLFDPNRHQSLALRCQATSEPSRNSPGGRVRTGIESALLNALARGFRWRKLLETGDFATIEEIAASARLHPSYVHRVLRLTLLAPEIVEAILAGKQPEGLTMARAMQPFPLEWIRQLFR